VKKYVISQMPVRTVSCFIRISKSWQWCRRIPKSVYKI